MLERLAQGLVGFAGIGFEGALLPGPEHSVATRQHQAHHVQFALAPPSKLVCYLFPVLFHVRVQQVAILEQQD